MGSLTRFNLRKLMTTTGISTLVETGTGSGKSIIAALDSGFQKIYSCESTPTIFQAAIEKFASCPQVTLYNGRSVDFLRNLTITEPAVYFLDAHFWGGADFGLLTHQESAQHSESFPLCSELNLLLEFPAIAKSVIIIDDSRLYYNDNFDSGPCPPELSAENDTPKLLESLAKFKDRFGCNIVTSVRETGYIIIYPGQYESFEQFFYILNSDSSPTPILDLEIKGVTGLSILRRMQDSRFTRTYLRGSCIDIGGGKDSLALYREFFPLLSNVYCYDHESGDAQYLENIPDNEFDCVYSSHCLEHLDDCRIGLRNWIRVVRPGGYLIITVPDEDLYEQGFWPSQFASHYHKWSFTIHKTSSWSPKSINILPELLAYGDAISILKVELINNAYHYALSGHIDQTRLPYGECSIEIILQKK